MLKCNEVMLYICYYRWHAPYPPWRVSRRLLQGTVKLRSGLKFIKVQLWTRTRTPMLATTEIISHTVWLYFRFTLSFHDIEECWLIEELFSHRKPSVNGHSSSSKIIPTQYIDSSPDAGINGIWMRWGSPSRGSITNYGVQ